MKYSTVAVLIPLLGKAAEEIALRAKLSTPLKSQRLPGQLL